MQQINPLYKSIDDLLSGNKFTIDEYQREYKRDRENITDLINDLLSKFQSLYKTGHSTSDVAQNVFEKLSKERQNGEYPKFFTIISNVKTIIRHGCDR